MLDPMSSRFAAHAAEEADAHQEDKPEDATDNGGYVRGDIALGLCAARKLA